MAKLSIIVPIYKVEAYLPTCIDSLCAQTLKDIEIILVDDGSPDNCPAICDEYAAKDARIKVIHKPNGGVSAARNDGLAAATGEWVIFCDSDDWMEPDALEKLAVLGEESGADVVFGDVNLVRENSTEKAVFYKDEFLASDRETIEKLIAADFCRAYCFNPPVSGPAFGYGGPWNKIVRRKLLLDNDIRFDLRVKGIFDDIIYTAHIFAAAKTVAYTHVNVYNYRLLGNSITQTYKANLLEMNQAIFTAWEEFMAKYGLTNKMRKPYYANVIRRLEAAIGMYFFNEKNTTPLSAQMKELKALLSSEPYCTAIAQADGDKLGSKYLATVLKCARKNSPFLLWMMYTVKQTKRKLKAR